MDLLYRLGIRLMKRRSKGKSWKRSLKILIILYPSGSEGRAFAPRGSNGRLKADAFCFLPRFFQWFWIYFAFFYAFDNFRIKNLHFINRHARFSCVILYIKEIKEISAQTGWVYFISCIFFCERRSVEALETGTVRHRRDIVRRFDVEDQASQHIHFSDPLGGIMHKLPLLI